MAVMAPVSWGELIDKITILEIKSERLSQPEKRANVVKELMALTEILNAAPWSPADAAAAAALTEELKRVNAALWDVEDHIRDCERTSNFGPTFIELARSVYHTNDRRAALKRQLNELAASELIEEKSYSPY